MNKNLFYAFAPFLFAACNATEFGNSFSAEKVVSAQEGLQLYQQSGQANQTISGTIAKVCQTEGCWFTYQLDSGTLFVDFGHKFEIPMNTAGRKIIAHGEFYRDTTSIEKLREFAKDEGKTKAEIEAITQPEIRTEFLASGVRFVEEK